MAVLFYNHGSTDHRGVWHKAYSIKRETIPETRQAERVVHFSTYDKQGNFKEHLGDIYVTNVTPEHVKTSITTKCGSFPESSPYIDMGLDYATGNGDEIHKKENIGRHIEYTWGPSKLILLESAVVFPPGPVCSRCKKLL